MYRRNNFNCFFFKATATTEIYTLSLHDALPISRCGAVPAATVESDVSIVPLARRRTPDVSAREDRKSTRLNSSHTVISYAVFCLKKKKKMLQKLRTT